MEWLAQHVLPNRWLERQPSDDDEKQRDREAVDRAHRVADTWERAIRAQRIQTIEDAWRRRQGDVQH